MHIAILTGGTSSERKIAIRSARTVEAALRPHATVSLFDLPEDLGPYLQVRKAHDVCIPVFHGKGGEDGTVQGFLETLGRPYIFSGPRAHAIGLDKGVTKDLVRRHGIKTPEFHVLGRGEQHQLGCPVVVKPLDSGSSVGIQIVRRKEDLPEAIGEALKDSKEVLVERFVSGEEFTVAVIEQADERTSLPVIQIRSKHAFFDFESKYDPELAEEICPAPIDDGLARRMQAIAKRAHEMIGARHVSRSDFIVDRHGEIWFLEINTIPGMTKESLFPKAVRAAGLDFGELLFEWAQKETQG